ncbi:MAG: SH3 domain-containing protein [Bacteroidota bacterium]
MEFGICLSSLIPVRFEPAHRSEMVTQVLFGELYRVVEKESSWVKIQLVYDNYEGWIQMLQANYIDEAEFHRLAGSETQMTNDLVQLLVNETKNTMIPILPGSSLPALEGQRLTIGSDVYLYEGSVADPTELINMTGALRALKIRQ